MITTAEIDWTTGITFRSPAKEIKIYNLLDGYQTRDI